MDPNKRFGPTVALRLELSGLQLHVVGAMQASQDEILAMIKDSVERELRPENIKAYIDETSRVCIRQAIKDEMQRYFSYGEGRDIIHKHMIEKLKKGEID